ncbi:Leucine Rich Repeat [Blomia tropicalis]|nr:Leucine Rich Repeat [Blomia tropicalis]
MAHFTNWTPFYLISLIGLLLPWSIEPKQINCDFNQLCLCQNYTIQYVDVTCINVPLVSVPVLSQYPHLYRIRLIGVAELTQLQANSFERLITLASLTISKSRLSFVNESTFAQSSIKKTLSTVEFSYGRLVEIPVNALVHLNQLQWLSLKGNQIEMIRSKDLVGLSSIRTLLLNENWLSIVEDHTFESLSTLELIDFDGNMIERVEGTPFPQSLKSLSISNCLLRKIPFASLQNLANLEVLQLRGNLISHLSPFKLAMHTMELIDLSHNLISNLPNDLFASFNQTHKWTYSNRTRNGEMPPTSSSSSSSSPPSPPPPSPLPLFTIRKFYLDFNFIHSIPPELFRAVQIEKLTLSSNRISSSLIAPNAFAGPLERSLKVLDLNYNLIDKYPVALKSLQALRQLLLKNNRIKQIDSDAFHQCSRTLEVLDLSQNLLSRMPREALSPLRQIVKVNMHDNLIDKLNQLDLRGWCHTLKSLTLSKNNLQSIEGAFEPCPHLTELRLGGNKLLQMDAKALGPYLGRLRLLELSSLHNVQHWLSEMAKHVPMQSLNQVKWLQFDYNQLTTIPSHLVKLFPSLMYLDLQNNHIENIKDELSQLTNLTTIILSHNSIDRLNKSTFRALNRLESIAIYYNRIRTIKSGAFDNLPKLHSLVLSKNMIETIETGAFRSISFNASSLTLMLDENRLRCLSADTFAHIGRPSMMDNVSSSSSSSSSSSASSEFMLYLNVSHNQIETFANCPHNDNNDEVVQLSSSLLSSNESSDIEWADGSNQRMQTLPIRVLDLSFNRITTLTGHFFHTFCSNVFSLLANNNLIRSLPTDWLWLCPHLQTLSLNYNHISEAATFTRTVWTGNRQLIGSRLTNSTTTTNTDVVLQIQTLSLRANMIKTLTSFESLFDKLVNLKWLDLSFNQIETIPLNFLNKTALIKLNLSHNRLQSDELGDQCFGVRSLKYLDITHNLLTTLPDRLASCIQLIELLASNNQIHSFNYLAPLARTLTQLQRLDLFENPIKSHEQRANFVFLNNHSMLDSLNLNWLNIEHLDELNVPYLHRLELSGNSISNINSKVLSRCRNLRWLNLSHNSFNNVPKHIWKYVIRLRHLDLCENPIEVLDSSSFAGLKYLKTLDIRGLKLQYIDSRIFLYQSQLSTLKISTYPSIRSFRLQDILSKSDALKTVQIDVKESILSHQIQWAFGGKLRELIITGNNLVHILPDAFQGLNNANDLTLRISNTSIRYLPEGLLKYLADIRYITIDLRNNQLQTVSPGVFFNQSTGSDNTKTWQSRQLLGGIILEGNPLYCDCNLLWISKWMKQIFTEMKSINIDAAIQVKASLALSRCQLVGSRHSNSHRPIEVQCVEPNRLR